MQLITKQARMYIPKLYEFNLLQYLKKYSICKNDNSFESELTVEAIFISPNEKFFALQVEIDDIVIQDDSESQDYHNESFNSNSSWYAIPYFIAIINIETKKCIYEERFSACKDTERSQFSHNSMFFIHSSGDQTKLVNLITKNITTINCNFNNFQSFDEQCNIYYYDQKQDKLQIAKKGNNYHLEEFQCDLQIGGIKHLFINYLIYNSVGEDEFWRIYDYRRAKVTSFWIPKSMYDEENKFYLLKNKFLAEEQQETNYFLFTLWYIPKGRMIRNIKINNHHQIDYKIEINQSMTLINIKGNENSVELGRTDLIKGLFKTIECDFPLRPDEFGCPTKISSKLYAFACDQVIRYYALS